MGLRGEGQEYVRKGIKGRETYMRKWGEGKRKRRREEERNGREKEEKEEETSLELLQKGGEDRGKDRRGGE